MSLSFFENLFKGEIGKVSTLNESEFASGNEIKVLRKQINFYLDEDLLFKCKLLQKFYGKNFSDLMRSLISCEFESKKKDLRRMMEESFKDFD